MASFKLSRWQSGKQDRIYINRNFAGRCFSVQYWIAPASNSLGWAFHHKLKDFETEKRQEDIRIDYENFIETELIAFLQTRSYDIHTMTWNDWLAIIRQ